MKRALLRLRARFAWIWRLGLIRRGTAFKWEVSASLGVLLLLMLALPAVGQVVDPPPPAWVPIASEGTYQGASPIVSLPVGTVFAFGLLPANGGVLCDPITVTNTPVNVVVWVSTFQATCMVGGKPPASGDGDPDPNQVKTLYVQQTTVAQSGTYTVPPSTTPISWSVPASGTTPPVIPPVIPPTTGYTIFLCLSTAPVSVTVDGGTPTAYPLPLAMVIPGTHTTLVVPGYGCGVVPQSSTVGWNYGVATAVYDTEAKN